LRQASVRWPTAGLGGAPDGDSAEPAAPAAPGATGWLAGPESVSEKSI